MKKVLLFLILGCIFLNIFDAITTVIILNNGGIEINPIMNYIMEKIGTEVSISISKFTIVMLLCWLMVKVEDYNSLTIREKRFAFSGVTFCNLVYIYFMYNFNLQYIIMLGEKNGYF